MIDWSLHGIQRRDRSGDVAHGDTLVSGEFTSGL